MDMGNSFGSILGGKAAKCPTGPGIASISTAKAMGG